MPSSLLQSIRSELKRAGDPVRAPQMQKYMKSAMPYHGVPVPQVRSICKKIFKETPLADRASWEKLVRELWHGATHREERYAALALVADKRALAFQSPATLALYEELIVSGAWWDFVDELATRRVGGLLEAHPKALRAKMLDWCEDENMWKRRTSILCQLNFKEKTDLKLLYACLEPSLDSREFFLRKAIGWALRQYARVSPREVKRYVKEKGERLSGLSRREALKHL